jgi:hypothetical protein
MRMYFPLHLSILMLVDRLSQDILLLPTQHNAYTHGDTQPDDHMPLPIIPIVTNPTQDNPPPAGAKDNGFEDEHTGKNSSENDEEISENSSLFHAAEEDNGGTRSDADHPTTSDSDGANPEKDPPTSRPPVSPAVEDQQPPSSAPLRVYTRRQSTSWAPPTIKASMTHALPHHQLSRAPSRSLSPASRVCCSASPIGRSQSPSGESPPRAAAPAVGGADPEKISASMLDPLRHLLLQLFLHLEFKPGSKKV